MANASWWLVNYLYDNGDKEKALTIAKEAADVYSAGGLNCLAFLYNRMGDLEKSEQVYKDCSERYDNDAFLTAFYLRNSAKNKHYAEESARLLKKHFPQGLQRIDTTKLAGPPKGGLKISDVEEYLTQMGIKNDDVLVAVNGYKIDTQRQCDVIRNVSFDPNLKVTIWDGKKYRDFMVYTVNNHRMGLSYANGE